MLLSSCAVVLHALCMPALPLLHTAKGVARCGSCCNQPRPDETAHVISWEAEPLDACKVSVGLVTPTWLPLPSQRPLVRPDRTHSPHTTITTTTTTTTNNTNNAPVPPLLQRDVAILEEPEHLNWFNHSQRWSGAFPHVVGIM